MITEQGLNFIHKIKTNRDPSSLYTLYNNTNRPMRQNKSLRPAYIPKSKHLKKSTFYKFYEIHSTLSDNIQQLPIKKFKTYIKKCIQKTYLTQTFPNANDTDSDDTD